MVSQDDERRGQDEIQKLTDRYSPRSISCSPARKRKFFRFEQRSRRAAARARCRGTWPSSWMAMAAGRIARGACARRPSRGRRRRCAWSSRSACGADRRADAVRFQQRELAPPARGGHAPDGAVRRIARGRDRRSCTVRACACASSASAPNWMHGCEPRWPAREQTTAANARLALQIALSYGGRSDILMPRAAWRCRSSAISSRRTDR